MRYNVVQLLKEPAGSFRDYQVDEEILLEAGVRERVEGHLQLTRSNRGIWVKGELVVALDFVCSRCLKSFRHPVKASIYEEFRPMLSSKGDRVLTDLEAEEGVLTISERHILDLEETLRQSLIVDRPLKPLCHAECKGICPVCGSDQNLSPCHCEEGAKNPQSAHLAEFLPRMGEQL